MPAQEPKPLKKGIRYLIDAINGLRDYVRHTRVIPTTGWTETAEGVLPPPYNKGLDIARSLRPTIDNSNDKATISGGYVNTLTPEIGGTEITDDPAPTLSISSSLYYIHLKITWTPGSYSTGGTPDYVPYGGTISAADFVGGTTQNPTNTDPAVNATTGAATTSGVFHVPWATISGSTGAFEGCGKVGE